MIMLLDQKWKFRQAAADGKYGRLFMCLMARDDYNWRTTFEEIEKVLRFNLPRSARLYSAWWANEEPGGRHTHALAWTAAGWKVAEVDMEAETLTFQRLKPARAPKVKRARIDLDKEFPIHHIDAWPEGLSLRREDIYEDRI